MIVITLARKPTELSTTRNVLLRGTGALHIDGSRIRTDDALGRANKAPKIGVFSDSKMGIGKGESAAILNPEGPEAQGRWPSNILFRHRPSCHKVGTREARGGAGTYCPYWPEDCKGHIGDGSRQEVSLNGPTRHGPPPAGWTPPARSETVPVWKCDPDCPVADLDAQSGLSSTPTSVTRGSGTAGVVNFGSHQERLENVACYGDSGGASRFFKQFGGQR
jgi:hypothetical protein